MTETVLPEWLRKEMYNDNVANPKIFDVKKFVGNDFLQRSIFNATLVRAWELTQVNVLDKIEAELFGRFLDGIGGKRDFNGSELWGLWCQWLTENKLTTAVDKVQSLRGKK